MLCDFGSCFAGFFRAGFGNTLSCFRFDHSFSAQRRNRFNKNGREICLLRQASSSRETVFLGRFAEAHSLSRRIKILLVVAVLSAPFARRSYKRRFERLPMTLVKKITNSLAS